ncbi:M20 metallopeptidase family protein [Brevibacterium aurantiacum]|uniref:M20 metallopeptidase family protein n=1 Tax=Brevibacterium aurantiacum TaxID=273384 RepID=UPI0018691906|nr:M20 family metallopeptidase [Brevibacterium aurantiacum]
MSSLQTKLVSLRRELHRRPEVGMELPETQQRLLNELKPLRLEVDLGHKCTSITAVLRGEAPGLAKRTTNSVLLRADMDALPIVEMAAVPFASEVHGVMHACGHDLHMAMLVGAANILSERRHELDGDVVLMFQPGEEGYDGASAMINEGALQAAGHTVEAAYALHVFSGQLPNGCIATKPQTMMASADGFRVKISGRGGHGSTPHLSRNPIGVMGDMFSGIEGIQSRRFDIFDPVVISIGMASAGTQKNIIPENAEFAGTVRCFSVAARKKVQKELEDVVQKIASTQGVEVELEYFPEYPPTVNCSEEAHLALQTGSELFGHHRVLKLPQPFAASEDFSRILEIVPGAFIALGAVSTDESPSTAPFNHSAYAKFDDTVLEDGAILLAELAMRRLRQSRK